ncbi:oligopeptide transporter [Cantharellus anzutake]|uniref:oligopeptide transporter n=1 Tax=Cantharellus anzutake TaxID=1750568 RepID=UPI0019056349|nr:oligopeptide transporter [Cantharellus anzutake]KAF8335067.1 oligopeptide transporter [Cantharellus anzutake]
MAVCHRRSIVVGCALGAVVGASNIYLGLKTGWYFLPPQLFGAIFGFAILKPLSKIVGGLGPGWVTGDKQFGPKENVTVQSAATAAGGLGIIFVSAVPAMYRLGLLSEFPQHDIGKLIGLAVCVAYYGVFFVIPLRKYYILKQKLVFPTPSATAYTIRQLHMIGGATDAFKKAKMLGYSLLAAFCFKVAAGYAPGLIWDWHIGWIMYRIGFAAMISLDNYGWWIEFTPAFYGAGMLAGMNASWSFFMGAILAWGIIAPSTIATGAAVGMDLGIDNRWSYLSLHLSDIEKYSKTPSPRYWLLWPGVLMMVVSSFAEVILSSRHAFYKMVMSVSSRLCARYRNSNRSDPDFGRGIKDDNDPAPLEDHVPSWAWLGGLIISIALTCSIVTTQWNMNVGEAVLALIFGFLLSFLAVRSAGDTDLNPVSTCAKASQLVFGGIAKSQKLDVVTGQTLNLVAGVLAAGASAQSADMTGDLKTGHLIGAKPKDQFVAQLTGATVAIFLNVALFILFTKSAPCILYPPDNGVCPYSVPAVSAWAAVATAVLANTLPIPPSSGYTAIALSMVAGVAIIVKHVYIPRRHWAYVPNWNAVGLAFILPQVYYPMIMSVGATVNHVWQRKNPGSFDLYGFPLAAGLIAGEGMGGVMDAILAIAGVDGSVYGTSIGCPSMQFCG